MCLLVEIEILVRLCDQDLCRHQPPVRLRLPRRSRLQPAKECDPVRVAFIQELRKHRHWHPVPRDVLRVPTDHLLWWRRSQLQDRLPLQLMPVAVDLHRRSHPLQCWQHPVRLR